jgi:glycosyltransferase involved in cell wall biosynthesis
LKIIAVLDSSMKSGGTFNQGLSAILQMKRLSAGRFDFAVITLHAENLDRLRKLGVECSHVKLSFFDRLQSRATHNFLWQFYQDRARRIGNLEKAVIAAGGDLVYFLSQSANSTLLQRTNFITTVFDLCHRDTPEFPEVRTFGEFHRREQFIRTNVPPALVTITESEQLSDLLARRYGVDRERLLALPLVPGPFISESGLSENFSVTEKYGLTPGYFFYPAQFWSHKNHIRILEALALLRERGTRLNVVFVGGNTGNRSHIDRQIAAKDLATQVKILGLVPAEDMRKLYEASHALVMPTYFGPTNIPPMEAWMLGKPVIYSAHLKEQVGSAALLVDPDSALELADAMQASLDGAVTARLIEAGKRRLQEIENQRAAAEKNLLDRLAQFETRLRCWQ